MSISFSKENIFPIKVGYSHDTEFNDYSEELIQWILEYKNRTPSVQVSNVGGWQSQGNFYFDEESFTPFMDRIWNQISKTLEDYSSDLELGGLISNGHMIKLLNIWINVNPPGSFNVVHIHPGSLLAGVLWVKYPKNSGYFLFRDPQEMNNYCLGNNVHPIIPTEGAMVMFPAFVPHNVDKNESDEDRISISFNLDFG